MVATAHESIAKGSKSFAAASLLFDPATRERAWLLYAWCRACDDIADGQDHGHDLRHRAAARVLHGQEGRGGRREQQGRWRWAGQHTQPPRPDL